jgi:transmembrane sensor
MPNRKFLKYAAAVVLLLNAALIFIYNQQEVKQPVAQVVQQHKPVQHEEQSKKAMLTLGDGSKLVLGEAENRKLAVEGTSNIQDQNGQLVYRAAGLPALSNLNLHHTITTPKGVTYQLILQDGTKIWLNTASTITYPVAFNGATRNVKITGEAYFEVAKNKRQPFIINANGTNIKVLGTTFNISAYAEDKSVKTTLLEGAVEVSKNNKQVTLVPDQQAVVSNAGDDMAVLKVDAAEAVAWKKGYFIFHHDDIKTVMQTIARWYDVEVEYRGDMTGKTFAGTIARFDTIEKLLKSLALTEAVNFKMEGRRVIVMP